MQSPDDYTARQTARGARDGAGVNGGSDGGQSPDHVPSKMADIVQMGVCNPPQPAAVPSHPLAPCEGVSLDRSQAFSSFMVRKDGKKSPIEARDRV